MTPNKRRQQINEAKLELLLSNKRVFVLDAIDRATNIENAPEVPDGIPLNKTGSLEKQLILKIDAPVVITSNPALQYK